MNIVMAFKPKFKVGDYVENVYKTDDPSHINNELGKRYYISRIIDDNIICGYNMVLKDQDDMGYCEEALELVSNLEYKYYGFIKD